VTRYRCVEARKAEGFPVNAACDAAGVSTSAFYEWVAREDAAPTARELDEAALVATMSEIFDESDGAYGVPRMWRELRTRGVAVNRKRVRRLMRLHGMAGRHLRRRVRTTIAGDDAFFIPDLVGRRFDAGAPDRAWCQDITYIATSEGWLFMASVLDLGSRRLVGYALDEHMRTELVLDALRMAIDARGGEVHGVIAHADRGTQYTSYDYLEFCAERHLRPSVGRTGICYDNSVAESFWATLKRECIQGRTFATRAEARRAIMRWFHWYNHRRIHTTLDGVAPAVWEHQFKQAS
jgi:transposase InsO family protein